MAHHSDSVILRSSLGAYLEELAESGIDGFPTGGTINVTTDPAISRTDQQTPSLTKTGTDSAEQHESLEKIRKNMGNCQRCKLGKTRKNLVFGVGSPQSRLVFIGDGPNTDEDLKGEPFAGEAGQVFNRIITAMGLRREDVYLCTVVKCRPPKDRAAEPDEISTCIPFLLRQLQSIKPEVIVALGAVASQTLLDTKEPIPKLRGKFRDFHGIPLMPTFHPSYLLRKKGDTGPFWEVWDDMVQVLQLLKLPVPDKSRRMS